MMRLIKMRLMILIAGMLSLPLIAQKAFTVAEAQIMPWRIISTIKIPHWILR